MASKAELKKQYDALGGYAGTGLTFDQWLAKRPIANKPVSTPSWHEFSAWMAKKYGLFWETLPSLKGIKNLSQSYQQTSYYSQMVDELYQNAPEVETEGDITEEPEIYYDSILNVVYDIEYDEKGNKRFVNPRAPTVDKESQPGQIIYKDPATGKVLQSTLDYGTEDTTTPSSWEQWQNIQNQENWDTSAKQSQANWEAEQKWEKQKYWASDKAARDARILELSKQPSDWIQYYQAMYGKLPPAPEWLSKYTETSPQGTQHPSSLEDVHMEEGGEVYYDPTTKTYKPVGQWKPEAQYQLKEANVITPSGQWLNRSSPTLRQMLAGYSNWAAGKGQSLTWEDLMNQVNQSLPTSEPYSQRQWKPIKVKGW